MLQSNRYTVIFALIICVTCSFTLSLFSQLLRERQEVNMAMDIKQNILKAVSLRTPVPAKSDAETILSIYSDKITEKVIDAEGNEIAGKLPEDITEDEVAYPLYMYKEDNKVVAFAIPIVGKGLWSTLYGYLALEPDGITVRGITFYKHGETPGLGAEIEQDWFQDNFKGKKIWDVKAGEIKPVAVVKGKVADKISPDQTQFYVDGISGATMTSNGVTDMIAAEIDKYEPFLKSIRSRR